MGTLVMLLGNAATDKDPVIGLPESSPMVLVMAQGMVVTLLLEG